MSVIVRVAGTGMAGSDGDGGPAVDAQLREPVGLAVTEDGGFLVADVANHTVRKVSATGVITRVAGTGTRGADGDDGPATDAQLAEPVGLAATADGGFLVTDQHNHTVRKVSATGVITRVAGTGARGADGDDGPATDAQLSSPAEVAVTADGGFLIADYGNNVVRKVSALGVITRVAGDGTAGTGGDDGPATDARLSGPVGIAVTDDGGFLITDLLHHTVRKVSASGVITRVAGDGTAGSGGDDGPATNAQLLTPTGVASADHGAFLIVDADDQTVRKVSASGVITRVAGNGTAGSGGADGPATDAELNQPVELSVTADGGFLIADHGNRMVRKVESVG